ncbi:RNA polymerase sigma factor [Specibacter sp. NPDC057265]|uniref:RNA polymerase sigma factor n=1 Tax=Specibacter sp. NPDC057265 TaxID=3346075 RepID=UPI003625FB95
MAAVNSPGHPGTALGRPAPGEALMAVPPFEALVAAHGSTVLRVCRALVGPVDADDLWQETFLAALRVYPGTVPVKNWQAWLVAIARNKCVDHHRRAAGVPQPTGQVAQEPPAGPDGVGRALEAAETARRLWAALARLPKMQREAVVYHHIAGLRYAEAAALLGNSEVAARRAAADGMKALRLLLAREEEH